MTWFPTLDDRDDLDDPGGPARSVEVVPSSRRPWPVLPLLLAAYAFLVPFGSGVTLPVGGPPFNTLSTLVGLLALVAGGLAVARSLPLAAPPPAVAWWVLLTAWLALTTVWSVDLERTVPALMVLASLVALYVVACVVPVEHHRLRWLEAGAAAGALYVALKGLALLPGDRLLTVAAEAGEAVPRFAAGASADPNITAASLLPGWVFLTWWALHATTRVRRVAATAGSSVVVVAILLTASRGGLIALVATTVVLLAMTDPSRRSGLLWLSGVAAAGAVVAWSYAPPVLQERLLRTSSTGRTDIWRLGLSACPETCWAGNGWASFPSVYQAAVYEHLDLMAFRSKAYVAHNIAVSMVVEAGVVGLVLLLLAFGTLVRQVRRLPRHLQGPPLAVLVALVVSNLFVSNLGFKYFWLTLLYATVASVDRRTRRPASPLHEEPS